MPLSLLRSVAAGSPPARADTACLSPFALLVPVCLLFTGTIQAGHSTIAIVAKFITKDMCLQLDNTRANPEIGEDFVFQLVLAAHSAQRHRMLLQHVA